MNFRCYLLANSNRVLDSHVTPPSDKCWMNKQKRRVNQHSHSQHSALHLELQRNSHPPPSDVFPLTKTKGFAPMRSLIKSDKIWTKSNKQTKKKNNLWKHLKSAHRNLLLETTFLSGVSADQMIVSWFIQDSNQRVHKGHTRTKIVVVASQSAESK